jgi:ubiquinone/menaquinone biosynthesis C-methylase UbiE
LGRGQILLDAQGHPEPFVTYATAEDTINWSEDLDRLLEKVGGAHFIAAWTRRAMLARVGQLGLAPTVIDIGCSAGHLLSDLNTCFPDATLLGVDMMATGLRQAHLRVPDALLLKADVCALPLDDASVDVVVSENLLEHVPNDELALAEIARILRPNGRAVIVVPVDPGCYDHFDRLLGHERRYSRGELAGKARGAGLKVLEDLHLGAPLFPVFWIVKRHNRKRYNDLRGHALEEKVKHDMERTKDSALGRLACRFEELLLIGGIKLPFGIRGLTVLERPQVAAR